MKAHLRWKDDRVKGPKSTLRALEWVFLIVGLLALDCFVWVNTSSVLYQAYEDWSFDQSLRGLTPGVGGFIHDEARWLLGGEREKPETAEAPQPAPGAPAPNETPNCWAAGQAVADRAAGNSPAQFVGDGSRRR